MGRTIPSFRIAAEMERDKWRDFRSKLSMKDRKQFDEMFSYVRLYNSNCMMQASPVVFHSVMISIVFHHYKQLMNLKGMKNILLPKNRHELDQECQRARLTGIAAHSHHLDRKHSSSRVIIAYFNEGVTWRY